MPRREDDNPLMLSRGKGPSWGKICGATLCIILGIVVAGCAGIYYFGHIGYHIDPPYRGRHFAYRACRLIEQEIRMSGKTSVVITCDPDNQPSRKTCERLGCLFERETEVPEETGDCKERNRKKKGWSYE